MRMSGHFVVTRPVQRMPFYDIGRRGWYLWSTDLSGLCAIDRSVFLGFHQHYLCAPSLPLVKVVQKNQFIDRFLRFLSHNSFSGSPTGCVARSAPSRILRLFLTFNPNDVCCFRHRGSNVAIHTAVTRSWLQGGEIWRETTRECSEPPV